MVNLIIPTLILSSIALIASLAAITLVIAQRMSTHKIEWRPLVQEEITNEVDEAEAFSDEAEEETLKKALYLQRKGKAKLEDPLDSILSTSNF